MLGNLTPASRRAAEPVERKTAIIRHACAVKARSLKVHEAENFLSAGIAAFSGYPKMSYRVLILGIVIRPDAIFERLTGQRRARKRENTCGEKHAHRKQSCSYTC